MAENKENSFLESKFKLKENGTTAKTEILAGITTFMTMGYILAVNPSILSDAGMDWGGVFTATALSAFIATMIMGLCANYPFGLAPGMGLNAFFTYTIVLTMGYTWQFALTAVFLEGIIFILLSFVGFREAIFNAIPINLKKAVSVGIGLFISLIGFINSGIVGANEATIISLGNLKSPGALLTIIGLIIMGVLLARNVKGALLIGILATTLIGIPMGITHLPEAGQYIQLPPSLAPVFMKFEWSNIISGDMLIIVFTFLFVDVFDTVGTLIGVASKADMLDEDGQLPRVKQALFADAVGTVGGACLGTSTVTTFVESASGVADGGRTGLTAVSTAVMFFLALFLSPIFGMIPSEATAPALIIVGSFMLTPIKEIDLMDYTEAIPAFLTIVMMPFAYSIAEGIVFGMISYVVLKVLSGRHKEVTPIMYVLAIAFVLKTIFL